MKRRGKACSRVAPWFASAIVAMTGTACQPSRVTSQPELRATPSAEPARPAALVASSTAVPPVPSVHPVLADPRLFRVHSLAADHDWASAERAFGEAEAALGADPRTAEERCAWNYVRARLALLTGDVRLAASSFDAAMGTSADGGARCALRAHAAYRAADAYLKAGDYPAANAHAREAMTATTVRDDAELVLASALVGEGHAVEAIPHFRSVLAKNPRGWIDVALPLASALLDGGEGDPDTNASEARELATRVISEAPRIAESSGAEAIRARAVARLVVHDTAARRTPRELTLAERAQQARAWADSGEVTKAASLTTSLLKDPRMAKEPALVCSVSITRAQALGRTKAGAGASWDEAIAQCEHDAALVTALYSGAKAAAGKRPDLARERYAKVEERFHDHRLADDARFQSALLALGQGDPATFSTMMLALPDDYPQGDMRTEALFRVALYRMTHGDWSGAAPVLDRIVSLSPDDQSWATAGRAEYFRARAARELGHVDDGRAGYARVLERHPFAYYMTQAYARLSEDDPSLATRTLSAAFAREDKAPFLSAPHAEFDTPAFATARALLEVGDTDLARRELGLAGALRDDVSPEVAWTVALLYDQAGAPEIGHAFARQKLRDYLNHYPVGAWRTKWEIAYPRAFQALVDKESGTSSIPTALTWGIMREESDFIADAKSSSSAFGLMQIILPTARMVARGTGLGADEASLKDPRVSVALGARLLGQLRSAFPANPTLAIAAYNAGGGAVRRWLNARGDEPFDLWVEEIPFDETRGYEKRVLSSEAAYAYLFDPAALDEVLRISTRARGNDRVKLEKQGITEPIP